MKSILKILKEKKAKRKKIINYMGGEAYELSPLETLKIVTTSSIFGEPAYYRDGANSSRNDFVYQIHPLFVPLDLFNGRFANQKTSTIMETIIQEALQFDFKKTLDFAVILRQDYQMRLNPQIIMVQAALHKKRKEFTKQYPGEFIQYEQKVMLRADEAATQLAYFLFKNNQQKNHCPNILKKSWAKKLSSLDAYSIAKYKNRPIKMIDVVRISHATSPNLSVLLQKGKIPIQVEEQTWENLRSKNMSWHEIFKTISLGHMALLKNLRNIFTEEFSEIEADTILSTLKNGVIKGRQFPFRYYSAYEMIQKSRVSHKEKILNALQDCMEIALKNMPTLKGKTVCLSDNSGSAWGTFNSEYGTVTVATIGNLSSVITCKNSDDGYVCVFGDTMQMIPINKNEGVLEQTQKVNQEGKKVGQATENGIWLFFKNAIEKEQFWDQIFIYSDMQAGHGGLYGLHPEEYAQFCYRKVNIDVLKLVEQYRKKVNPKVNVFSVQTAGYENVILPEYTYRCNILSGWTGKELIFADEMIRFWNNKEKKKRRDC